MKNLIENTISWNKIGSHMKSDYHFNLGKAKMSKDGSVLTLDVELNFVMPFQDMLRLQALIINQITGLNRVDFNFIYEEIILTKNEIIKLYIEHMIYIVNGEFASITKTIKAEEFKIREEELIIFAIGNIAVEQLNKNVAAKFENILKEKFDINIKIKFDNHIDAYSEMANEKRKISQNEIEQVHSIQKKSESVPKKSKTVNEEKGWNLKKSKVEEPASGNRIMGKPVNDQVVSLESLTPETGNVAVEGVLFRIESRTIRNDKKLITLLITDKKTSVCLKAFTSITKWEEIDELLKPGDWIKVKGNTEWDTYENQLVLMIKDIEKCEKTIKEDTCNNKRVELHAHTKMSAMDGLNEISELIKTAARWGHKAIAITDHGVVQAFPEAPKIVKKNKLDIKIIYGLEGYLFDDKNYTDENGDINYKGAGTNHVIILAKTQEGIKNLYKLVSTSHLDYFYKKPRIPKSILNKFREGLIIGSACEAGEVYQAILKKNENIKEIIDFYDYLEIQPIINNQFLIDNGTVEGEEELRNINRKIIEVGKTYGKLTVATCDSHYTSPEENLYRKILMAGQGYKDIEGDKGLYLRTTDEMLEEFSYLGKELAYSVVVENPNTIAETIEEIKPIASGKFPPKIDNADQLLRDKCMSKAWELYGNPLPKDVQARLDRELNSIINNGYAVMYVSAEMLVRKSLEDGYLVGSRGSVGSSFAATMDGITEVNPLPPHYICRSCNNFQWGDNSEYDCGVDMPEKKCPNCGEVMKQEGFDIPFEVFLGFEGDKEPDIDLNFAGEYQSVAHKYVEEIFGRENVFRAGTIGTIAGKTAYGFVKKYFEDREQNVNKWEIERLTECCTGVRRTTGQHPGGIIIVPRGHEIYEFCPVQRPANDVKTDIITTHFDYHSIDENLLKLDILGHDVPSMIRQLQDMTGVDPLKVPLNDEKVKGLFLGIETLDIKDENYKFRHGSFGIPEFGTKFVRQMLDDTKPTRFGDLVRISGFSHGTDVWLNNAQEYIRSGVATMKDAISTRDDIMNYLIHKGLPNSNAFKIMENVRKGKGLSEKDMELMSENNVPQWYIDSCNKIKYMFPRAHAVAYVMMSYRIAYYKVYYPRQFYATYFTTKVSDFDAETILKGQKAILEKIESIENKGKNATKKEEDSVTVMELAYEMYARGYQFGQAKLGDSDASKFKVLNEKVLIPFMALSGVGENAAKLIVEEHGVRPFHSIEEIQKRAKANKTAIEALKQHGVLAGLPETDQLCLF